jgi:hypothetical protein
MQRIILALSATAAVGLAGELQAQQRVTVDLRAAAAVAAQKLAGTELDAGIGFGGTLAFRIQPHLHVYGGWDWLHFSADDSFAGSDRDFEETGYTFGLRFEHPVRGEEGRLAYRLEGGGTFKHIEIEDDEGELVADSDHGLGFEVGAALLMPLGDTWRFVPALRYRSLDRDFRIGSTTTDASLRYVSLELGISRRF